MADPGGRPRTRLLGTGYVRGRGWIQDRTRRPGRPRPASATATTRVWAAGAAPELRGAAGGAVVRIPVGPAAAPGGPGRTAVPRQRGRRPAAAARTAGPGSAGTGRLPRGDRRRRPGVLRRRQRLRSRHLRP